MRYRFLRDVLVAKQMHPRGSEAELDLEPAEEERLEGCGALVPLPDAPQTEPQEEAPEDEAPKDGELPVTPEAQ